LAAASGEDGKPDERILRAIDSAAEALGNTRAVCRSSYVHPEIPEAYLDGRLKEAWENSRRGTWLSRAESAGRKLLEDEGT
jgi:DNA topoisomerase-1